MAFGWKLSSFSPSASVSECSLWLAGCWELEGVETRSHPCLLDANSGSGRGHSQWADSGGNRLLTCGSSSLRADQRRGQSGPGELQTAGWRRGGEHQRGGTEQLPEGGRFLGERILQDPAAGGAQVGRTGGRRVPPAPPPPVKSLFFKPPHVDFMVPHPPSPLPSPGNFPCFLPILWPVKTF